MELEKRGRIHSREKLESTFCQAIRSVFWGFKRLKIQMGFHGCVTNACREM